VSGFAFWGIVLILGVFVISRRRGAARARAALCCACAWETDAKLAFMELLIMDNLFAYITIMSILFHPANIHYPPVSEPEL
jgi:hypothetical protein